MASSILVIGGTAMLPGFIPRLHNEILRAIAPPPAPTRLPTRPGKPLPPQFDRFAALRPLTSYFAILNNPTPGVAQSERARANAGKAPAFTPATMAWVGGSLAGSLKTGGSELAREKWDEAGADGDTDNGVFVTDPEFDVTAQSGLLPDWTRSPLPSGAASAGIHASPAQARVGA